MFKLNEPMANNRCGDKSGIQKDRNRKNVRSPGRPVGQSSTKNLAVLDYRYIELENMPDEKWADPYWREMHDHYMKAWWIDMAEKELGHLSVERRAEIIGIHINTYYKRRKLYNIPIGGVK